MTNLTALDVIVPKIIGPVIFLIDFLRINIEV
jgi:hypothetical protein